MESAAFVVLPCGSAGIFLCQVLLELQLGFLTAHVNRTEEEAHGPRQFSGGDGGHWGAQMERPVDEARAVPLNAPRAGHEAWRAPARTRTRLDSLVLPFSRILNSDCNDYCTKTTTGIYVLRAL
ncbi:hypothetical protein NDU88_005874 [Pleurodeles waltl]|uniref:Secreted protein n=1 Tax=Pleurodeles waltl TaxID=8319 RepID=A0AAV7TCB1_PLEWA|nr:hypothetical protein NDU88_005874 [Pleurodeles waltl]